MNEQNKIALEDLDLIEFYTFLEEIMKKHVKKSEKDWFDTPDFAVFSKFITSDVRNIQNVLPNATDDYLYTACERIFNIQDWIKLMVEDAGFSKFSKNWQDIFEKEFGDKDVLQTMYSYCFDKWMTSKSGQQRIGVNFYHIHNEIIYYRDSLGSWFTVDRSTSFDPKPTMQPVNDIQLSESLNSEYTPDLYDVLIEHWNNSAYQASLPAGLLDFNETETSPEDYFDFSFDRIKSILDSPVSVAELEKVNGGPIDDLKYKVMIANFVLDTVARRRLDKTGHTVYLLRDCLTFYEAHKALDYLTSESTSADQILVGRKLLSIEPEQWEFYGAMVDGLYTAHLRYPTDFSDFYNEYSRLMNLFVENNQNFASLVAKLAVYIKAHVVTDRQKIVVFDIGFQGSIALLTKYVIDQHIQPTKDGGQMETDIEIAIGAVWSMDLYGHRYYSDYFPMLNRIQQLERNNELYHYKHGSVSADGVKVTMGNKDHQKKASVELLVLLMIAKLQSK
jgi:hypothetical protein